MFKRMFFVLFFGALTTQAVSPYISLSGGLSQAHDSGISGAGGVVGSFSYDIGYSVGGALGLNFAPEEDGDSSVGYRVEAALDYQSNKIDTIGMMGREMPIPGNMAVFSGFVNGYVDYYITEKWSVYGMGGVGVSDFTMHFMGMRYSDTVGAAQLGFGAGYALTENLTFDLGYTYQMFQDMGVTAGPGADVEMENSTSKVQLCIRYGF